jgi:putative flippase GtrA
MLIQFLRYAGAGAIGTAAQFAILITLVERLGTNAIIASTAGAIAGAVVNYAINHRLTFASGVPHARAFPRFAAVALAGMALNALVLAGVLAADRTHYVVAQVVATGAVLCFTYVFNRTWTF